MTHEILAPPIVINVSLDTSVTPHVLELHVHGATKVDPKSDPQPIRWHLTGALANGEFVSLHECRPGFEWLSVPPPAANIFSRATASNNNKVLEIIDTHQNATSKGTWLYRLRVRDQNVVYETILTIEETMGIEDDGSHGTPDAKIMVKDNPVIINR